MRDDKACGSVDSAGHRSAEEEVKKAQAESVGVNAIDLAELSGSTSDTLNTATEAASLDDDDDIVVLETVSRASNSKAKAISTMAGSSKAPKPNEVLSTGAASKPGPSNPRKPVNSLPAPVPISNRLGPVAPSGSSTQTLVLPSGEWQCPTCTLLNLPHISRCDACTTPRPVEAAGRRHGADGWMCDFCGHGPIAMGFWSCSECGWVRKWG
jgi:hypothetical protein